MGHKEKAIVGSFAYSLHVRSEDSTAVLNAARRIVEKGNYRPTESAPDVSEGVVHEVLGRQAAFAEEVLAAFLPLVGTDELFAHSSYECADEYLLAELAPRGIRLEQHLTYSAD